MTDSKISKTPLQVNRTKKMYWMVALYIKYILIISLFELITWNIITSNISGIYIYFLLNGAFYFFPRLIKLEACSATATKTELGFPEVNRGRILASTTRIFSMPRTLLLQKQSGFKLNKHVECKKK